MIIDIFSKTLLRIWDCFLLEGPKVLFRFSLAILKNNEDRLLEQTDTISLLRYLKVCTKLLFDAEGMVKVSSSNTSDRCILCSVLCDLINDALKCYSI